MLQHKLNKAVGTYQVIFFCGRVLPMTGRYAALYLYDEHTLSVFYLLKLLTPSKTGTLGSFKILSTDNFSQAQNQADR